MHNEEHSVTPLRGDHNRLLDDQFVQSAIISNPEPTEWMRFSKNAAVCGALSSAIFHTFVFTCLFAGYHLLTEQSLAWTISLITCLSLQVGMVIMSYVSVQRQKFALRWQDIIFCDGLVWKSAQMLPFIKIQHISRTQGPLQRLYGLASVEISTAGGGMSIHNVESHVADDLVKIINALILEVHDIG